MLKWRRGITIGKERKYERERGREKRRQNLSWYTEVFLVVAHEREDEELLHLQQQLHKRLLRHEDLLRNLRERKRKKRGET